MKGFTAALLLIAGAATGLVEGRPFEVEDVLKLETPGFSPSIGRSPIAWSPDHRRFYIVLRGYDVATDSFCNRLHVHVAADVSAYLAAPREPARPSPIASFSFCMNSDEEVEEAITEARWMPDSERIVLIARKEKRPKQIFLLDVRSRSETAVTNEKSDIHSFDWVDDTLVFTLSVAESLSRTQSFFVEREGLLDLLGIGYGRVPQTFRTVMLDRRTGKRMVTAEPLLNMLVGFQRLRLSPDGRNAVAMRPARRVPPEWQDYRLPFQYRFRSAGRDFPDPFALQYVLIDTRTGSVRPLLDAPTRDPYAEIYWTRDSKSVVLASTLLPLRDVAADERDRRTRSPATVEINTGTGQLDVIAFRPFNTIQPVETEWDSASERIQLTLASSEGKNATAYAKTDGGWRAVAAESGHQLPPLDVSIKRSPSAPTEYWATDRATGSSKPITDLGQALGDVQVSPTENIEWLDHAGRKWQAGLIKPIGVSSGKRYPLLIQTHGYWGATLLLDGPLSSGYAAQALAAKGVVVLQFPDRHEAIGAPDEADVHMDGLESAIEKLVAERLVDREKVALMGFSRSCYYVRFALVHSKMKFAAGVVLDGLDAGYTNYLHALNSPADDLRGEYEKFNGGAPFGDGLVRWMQRAPGFNLHRVTAPLLIQTLGRRSLRSEWEFFAGLKILGKAVEMLVHPISPHVPVRPSQILATQNATVDWVLFWLKGEERPGSAKRDQYERWRMLRNAG